MVESVGLAFLLVLLCEPGRGRGGMSGDDATQEGKIDATQEDR